MRRPKMADEKILSEEEKAEGKKGFFGLGGKKKSDDATDVNNEVSEKPAAPETKESPVVEEKKDTEENIVDHVKRTKVIMASQLSAYQKATGKKVLVKKSTKNNGN